MPPRPRSGKYAGKTRMGPPSLPERSRTMTEKQPHPDNFADLHRRAEEKARAVEAQTRETPSPEKAGRLLHELQVHQIELEMQNEELLRAREALQEASDKYHDLFDFAPVGYFRLDEQGGILEVNLAGAALLGLDRSTALRQRFGQYVTPQFRARFAELLREALQAGSKQSREIEIQRNGELAHTVVEAIPAHDGVGNRSLYVTATDISGRKKAEEALRQNHDQLQTVYEGMIEGLLITDIETKRFLRVNSSLCRMLGYSEEELLAASVQDIHPREEVSNDLQRFQAAAEGRVSINEDRPVLRKDGSIFYADITGRRILYGGRPCLLALFRDVTERRQAQAALQRERRTLKHMLRASDHERQLIAYEIHDELAQQLAGAIMQFQVYDHLKDTNAAEAQKAYDGGVTLLRQGHREARRLISGVRPPILDESGVLAAIAHLVNEHSVEGQAQIVFHSNVKFKRLAPILENVIYRIVQEGLTNAFRHSKSELVRIILRQRGSKLRIKIQDWGTGFDLKTVQGTGFGLAGIRERARLLGGKYRIESRPSQGTRIVVELPLAEREEGE